MFSFLLFFFEKVHSGDKIFIMISKCFFNVHFQNKSTRSKTKETLLLQMTFSIDGL